MNPATVEVVRHALLRACDEMKLIIRRTSPSPLTYEMQDFSVALMNENADLLGQSAGLPHFLGNLGTSVRTTAEDIGGFDRFEEGDVYITNDPYRTTLHLADVTAFSPIFFQQTLVGFAVTRAHWIDIGSAKTVGGLFSEVFPEGTFYKSVRVYERGKPNESILRIIGGNSRLPWAILGDLRAQAAACKIGGERYNKIIGKYGLTTFREAVQAIFEHGERTAREEAKKIPKGTYEGTAYMDNDAIDLEKSIKIKVAVTVDDEGLLVDVDGSSGPVGGNCNCGLEQARTGARTALMSLVAPTYFANEGFFKPLRFKVPESSIFNAKWPSGTMFSWMPVEYLIDLIHTSLSQAIPDRVAAATYGCASICHIHGYDEMERKYWVLSDTQGGGWGGMMGKDGESAMKYGDVTNPPCEFVEKKYNVMVERYELVQDSGGPGKWRGGLGVIRDYRILGQNAKLHAVFERHKNRPWGIRGGSSGGMNDVYVNFGGPNQVECPKVTALPLERGDVVRLMTGGGGGFGNPKERDHEMVKWDVVNGYVSRESAEKDYGFKLNESTRKEILVRT
ncbi:MAG: hydantoinase B/oxoprolinase family protein [Thaumarchaeota archaeon]|nr:hydantoinase B/oxoprolinase family protein [Nitrososphaerota archaeon]